MGALHRVHMGSTWVHCTWLHVVAHGGTWLHMVAFGCGEHMSVLHMVAHAVRCDKVLYGCRLV